MKNNNTPDIRFSGFTDNWELRKLGDILSNMKSGLSRMLSNDDIGLPVIRANNINNGILDLVNELKFWYREDPQGANTQNYLVHKNDILVNFINSEAKMGTAAIVETEPTRPTIYTTNILNLRTNQDICPYFVFCLTLTKKYKDYIKTITKPAVNQASFTTVDLKKYKFSAPTSDEQMKIGKLFKQLDGTTTLHQHELEALKKTKKGFLQKMFPKEGESVPEIRFPGFTDDWEQRKLGEVADIVGGSTPSTNIDKYWNGDIDWYSPIEIGEQIYVNESQKKITELGLQKSSAKILPVGTVLFTSRAGIGNTAILAKEGTTNQGFQSIVPHKDELDSYFIFSRTHELKRYGETNGAGSTFVEVSGKQMSKMSILVPNMEEQIKIGMFFKQLDETIALHQRELEALKETKKAFLQKMFINI